MTNKRIGQATVTQKSAKPVKTREHSAYCAGLADGLQLMATISGGMFS